MQLGIYLNSQHPEDDDAGRRLAELVEQVRLIRQLGFDSIWTGEHHVTPGFHFYPQLPLLQRLAAEAEGLWIGTNLMLLPLHNPVEVAEIGAFMDLVTGGKFILGVGLGYRPEEFAAFAVPMPERVGRFNEAVELIKRLWTEDRVTHRGRHWQIENATIRPRPLQSPRPAILVGAQVKAAIERAATLGDGWLIVPIPTLDQLARQMQLFRTTRSAVGLPPTNNICRLMEVSCAKDSDGAFSRAAPYLMEKYKAYFSWGLEGLQLDPDAAPEAQLRSLATNRFVIGSPSEVVEGLIAQHGVGVAHASMRISWPGMPQDEILAGIELLGTQVLPEVRRRCARARQA